jgi:hypothetical protein
MRLDKSRNDLATIPCCAAPTEWARCASDRHIIIILTFHIYCIPFFFWELHLVSWKVFIALKILN